MSKVSLLTYKADIDSNHSYSLVVFFAKCFRVKKDFKIQFINNIAMQNTKLAKSLSKLICNIRDSMISAKDSVTVQLIIKKLLRVN